VHDALLDGLIQQSDGKILLFVMDGVGDLPYPGAPGTALQAARTPNLDALAARSSCGLLDPVAPGITPGSGPAHLGLFGYDPVRWVVGRGVLEALGAGFSLKPGDLAIRANFCTLDAHGRVTDRRAGRIATQENRRLVAKLRSAADLPQVDVFIGTAAEHRAYIVLRGGDLSAEIRETDPQKVGVPPLAPEPLSTEATRSAELLKTILGNAREALAGEDRANMLLLRGYAIHRPLPSFRERYGLRAIALADYPMYRGLAALVGMQVSPALPALEDRLAQMASNWTAYDFFFLHYKKPDSAGEDGDFPSKIRAIEHVDMLLPSALELEPDVVVITADHSTPCLLKAHSWHPVPVLLQSKHCLPDGVTEFHERACVTGSLGRMSSKQLMPVMLANAGRLRKYGA
jgi:2,3-bisphosphoglycerate-independent phosphoglycerate mutase